MAAIIEENNDKSLTVKYNTGYFPGDKVIITFMNGIKKAYEVMSNRYFKPIEDIEKVKSNLHINKQRSQSKINGKNSRWC